MTNWFKKQAKDRPLATALVILLAIAIPSFARVQSIADEAHDTAKTVEATEKRESAEEAQEALLSCQTRNTFQQNTRDKFVSFNNAIELAFTGSASQSPERAEATRRFIEQLRESVESNPEEEDRDCNSDGVFDETDYLP